MNTRRYGWNARGQTTSLTEYEELQQAKRQGLCQHNFVLQQSGEGDAVVWYYECERCGFEIDDETPEIVKAVMAPGLELPL